MNAISLVLCAIAGSLALLSTGCAGTEAHNSNLGLLMPGTSVMPPVQRGNDQDFYQPPGDPQFNTARDQ
jgi:hypothetical protein